MPNYGLGETFDLARIYGAGEAIKGERQEQTLRGLQIDAIRNPKPKELSYEEQIGRARVLNGVFGSLVDDPSDANIARMESFSKTNGIQFPSDVVDSFRALPIDQRKAQIAQGKAEIEKFLANAVEQKQTKAGYGAPQSGINPATGKPEQFIVDDNGTVKWLGIPPVPGADGSGERSPYHTAVYTGEGIYDFNNRTGVTQPSPGGPGILKTTDNPAVRGAVSGAEEGAKLDAQRAQQIEVKIQNMGTMDSLLESAGPLIRTATGSFAGAGVDLAARVIGFTPTGAESIAALRVIGARLLENVPRMEGPQSDADRAMYEQAAGQVGDPTVTTGAKLAAIRTIKALNAKYRALNPGGALQGTPTDPASQRTAPAGVDPAIWAAMTPEEQALWPTN